MAYLGRKGASAALTSSDIPDGSISAVKVAADVATQAEIDLKANLASPTLTTPNLGIPSAITLTNATFPTGHIIHVQEATLAGGAGTTSATTFYDTGLEITIPSATVALGSKIFLSFSHGIGIQPGTSHTRVDAHLNRTAPTSAEIVAQRYLGENGTSHTQLNFVFSGSGIDTSLGSGDHVYKVQLRKANASHSECGNINYNWYTGSLQTIQAMVIK